MATLVSVARLYGRSERGDLTHDELATGFDDLNSELLALTQLRMRLGPVGTRLLNEAVNAFMESLEALQGQMVGIVREPASGDAQAFLPTSWGRRLDQAGAALDRVVIAATASFS
ncbi:hypothetical protein AB0H77_14685 [Streptomyces sp. NPDC050844]|uniref:hypothetical protein n=1 Tax=Streptomyces sp. NPDC050844 TaxID=3155790 RepID=UPI0033C35E10